MTQRYTTEDLETKEDREVTNKAPHKSRHMYAQKTIKTSAKCANFTRFQFLFMKHRACGACRHFWNTLDLIASETCWLLAHAWKHKLYKSDINTRKAVFLLTCKEAKIWASPVKFYTNYISYCIVLIEAWLHTPKMCTQYICRWHAKPKEKQN